MPRMFIKVENKKTKKEYFVGWSTISDSVNSDVMDAESFKKNVTLTDEQQKSLDETGCSNPYYTIEELVDCSDDFPTMKALIEYCETYVNLN
jgi:hypothetical protein